jgi:4'-phosphopantetheinyl transferase
VTVHTSDDMQSEQVALWWIEVDVPESATMAAWATALDEDERARAGRLRIVADRHSYVAGHALVRALLGTLGNRPAHHWRFMHGPFGKPEVDPALDRDLRFNLSHTRGLAVAACCRGHAVGVDAEAATDRQGMLGIADDLFASDEVRWLGRLPQPERLDAFLRLWTLKEAWAKATGDGLRTELASVRFTLDPLTVQFRNAGDERSWHFSEMRPTPRHVVAVAVHGAAANRLRIVPRAVTHCELALLSAGEVA